MLSVGGVIPSFDGREDTANVSAEERDSRVDSGLIVEAGILNWSGRDFGLARVDLWFTISSFTPGAWRGYRAMSR